MALSRIEGPEELYVGGLWALRRFETLTERNITHVLSLVPFDLDNLKNFKDEPWTEYGQRFQHMVIDIDDVDDADLLIELPRAVRFIDKGLRGISDATPESGIEARVAGLALKDGPSSKKPAVFVHCAAGKSRSVSTIVAYLLWRHPERFDPDPAKSKTRQGRLETAEGAVGAALELIRKTRPMAEPNDGFMAQLALWWAMGCPEDVEGHPGYQRWAYKREVEENVAVGQAPSRLRFEDEAASDAAVSSGDETKNQDEGSEAIISLRCKKCRHTLASSPFIAPHGTHSTASAAAASACPHFIEPLSWMRGELERGDLNGRLLCPTARCGAAVGRYDWKGFKCGCGIWVTPAFSLQRGRVDESRAVRGAGDSPEAAATAARKAFGIRMPPGRGGNL